MSEAASRPWGRRLLRLGGEVLLVIAVVYGISMCRQQGMLRADGSPAPELALYDLDGQLHRLEDYRGKTVHVHFWATWCGVCKTEFGALRAAYRSLDDDEALLTVVADGQDPDAIRRFAEERDLDYPILLGNDAVVSRWKIEAYPTSYYIDPEGRVEARWSGRQTRWGMKARRGCAR